MFWRACNFQIKMFGRFWNYENIKIFNTAYFAFYFRHLRMTPPTFDYLFLRSIAPVITKINTNFGNLFQWEKDSLFPHGNIKHRFFFIQNRKSKISNILKETSNAIYHVLAPTYLRPPAGADGREHITSELEQIWNMTHVIGTLYGKI